MHNIYKGRSGYMQEICVSVSLQSMAYTPYVREGDYGNY